MIVFMKKVGLLLLVLFVCLGSNAQGVYQMWGISREGGSANLGTIYSVAHDGSNLQTHHSFTVKNYGSAPKYSELVEYNGKFYGTTTGGGIGYGTIFQWDASTNEYIMKYAFTGTSGRQPFGTMAVYNGRFYGTSNIGGTNNVGVIFEWDPATNIYTKKIDLSLANGCSPYGGMKLHNDKFYGLTSRGGTTNEGTIYEWDPATNIYTKKIDLTSSTLGAFPYGSLVFNGTTFYATARYSGNGSGAILEWNPVTNVCTKKYEFVRANGATPYNDLTYYNGSYFGFTASGGLYSAGVIFEWNPATNVYIKRFDFSGTPDSGPQGHFTVVGNKLYALSYYGGGNSYGFVIEWDPVANQMSYKSSFDNATGWEPISSFTVGGDGKLYSTTAAGGSENAGTIFEWSPSTNTISTKISFNGNEGKYSKENLVRDGNKLYGMTKNGGANGTGVIFEWDLSTGIYTRKTDFTSYFASSIRYPSGKLVKYGTSYYGLSESGGIGSDGAIFQWSPVTNTLTQMAVFNSTNGEGPMGSMVLYGNKFYGMTSQGGSGGTGVIFEWDPTTNTLSKKIDLTGTNGKYPYGDLVLYDNKFYGMTYQGGINNAGVIFEWDPATNVYSKKVDLSSTNGSNPYGNLTLYNNKFYGLTSTGGTGSDGGVIFEWDPAINIYTRKYSFTMYSADGSTPYGTLTMNSEKFYGVTYRGGAASGVLFEWDPATNAYTKKANLSSPGPASPFYTELLPIPAPVSSGNPGHCLSLSSITIDASNSNVWVPITDLKGDVVAEIKANGNILGIVSNSMFINNGTVREDEAKRLYLDRNLTITPQVQPSSPVDIRLYIRSSEYLTLKNAVSSNGQPSGINSITDISIFKNSVNSCSSNISQVANPVASTVTNWENDYVLSASITSFSSFYFANKAFAALPLNLLDFKGRLESNNALLNWKTDNEQNTSHFEIERSINGVNYTVVGNVSSANTPGIHNYSFADPAITSLGAEVVYYRLKQIDIDKRFTYSQIVTLSIENRNVVLFYPNPVTDKANLTIILKKPEQVQLKVIDNIGRVVKQQQWNLPAGSTSLSIDMKGLMKGLYYLELIGNNVINRQLNFIKQ